MWVLQKNILMPQTAELKLDISSVETSLFWVLTALEPNKFERQVLVKK